MENVLAPTISLDAPSVRSSRTSLWTGRVLTGLVVTFLLVDAVAKLDPARAGRRGHAEARLLPSTSFARSAWCWRCPRCCT